MGINMGNDNEIQISILEAALPIRFDTEGHRGTHALFHSPGPERPHPIPYVFTVIRPITPPPPPLSYAGPLLTARSRVSPTGDHVQYD